MAKSAVGTNTFRETSHSFTLVLRDFYSDILFKNADDIVELFTTRGVWISCRNVKDLDDAIARDCKWLWAPSGPSRPGEMPRVPPTPFNDDVWHSARREAILKGASRAESQPLDAQCRFKLLFPPAEDDPRSVAMVYNFLTDKTRPAQPGDRLYMRTNFPYKPFEVSEATERIVDNFMELYFNWHLVGSGLLDGEEEDGGEEVKRAWRRSSCARLEWFRGQAEQWVTLEEDGAINGSADKMLFIRKMDAKIFSRTDKFVGFVCITGPPGGGKGTVIYTLRGLAAMDKPICNMGATTSSTTGSAGRGLQAGVGRLAGKAASYCDEYPNRRINPKTDICARGGQVSARFGGPRRAGNYGDHSHAHWCRLPHHVPPEPSGWQTRSGISRGASRSPGGGGFVKKLLLPEALKCKRKEDMNERAQTLLKKVEPRASSRKCTLGCTSAATRGPGTAAAHSCWSTSGS